MENKSPVFSYLGNPTMIDFPGYLAGMFFVKGCNFRCGFCHNARLLGGKALNEGNSDEGFTWEQLDEICETMKNDWIDGAVISGGEPTLYGDKIIKLIHALKKHGFKVKLDTNGSIPDVLEKALGTVDYVAMDIKCSLEKYPELTHYEKTDNILQSINLLRQSSINYEMRTTVIESFHSQKEMLKIADLIHGIKKYVLQPFVPRDDLLDEKLTLVDKTSKSYLESIYALLSDCAEEIVIR
jgi:pyruvate formate lyase activating enzyme